MLLGDICVREYKGRPYILIIPELVDGLRIRFVLVCVSDRGGDCKLQQYGGRKYGVVDQAVTSGFLLPSSGLFAPPRAFSAIRRATPQ